MATTSENMDPQPADPRSLSLTQSGCCAPTRPGLATSPRERPIGGPAPDAAPCTRDGFVRLPGGTFLMGSEAGDANPGDGEGPVRPVTLDPFWMSRSTVTNADFAAFVEATDYRTGAERFGWSFVFAAFLPASLRRGAVRPPAAPWWCRVDDATWRAPEGPGSSIDDRLDHPVVHVDHQDALAYCAWMGGRLPTEAEWEYAARGGLTQATFPWGNDLTPGGQHRCNIWQGRFPTKNTADDGFFGTAPARAFPPNGYGLFNTAGNVWEWCADWWSTSHQPEPQHNPIGAITGTKRVMRGGSYLCHYSYCNRYRVAARTSNDPHSSSGNAGFRCAMQD
jgi:formylglycine-generating enzyme